MLSVSILLLAIAAVLLCSIVHKHFLHPLSNFRGPFWAAQTDLWRAYHLCTKRLPDTLETLHTKYGPVVRIGPNDLSFKSVAAIPQIYKSGRKVVKSSFYDGFTTFHPNLFGTRDEDLHALRRRQMAHSFSQASLMQMEHVFDRHIEKLLVVIDAQGPNSFDLKELVAYYTYDVMGELIFNADFGSQDAQNPNLLPPINNHIWLGCVYGMLPALLPYSMRLSPWIPLPWVQDKLVSRKALRDMTAAHVAAELARDKKVERQNILNRLVNATDPETGAGLTDDTISSEAFAFLVAGSHTTSGSLTLLFCHLLHNPVAAKQLTEELARFMPLGDQENRCGSIPAFSGLEQQLPYMTSCVREAFRVSPVFTMPLPRKIVEYGGMEIDGYHVPQGTNVSMCNQVVHHDVSAWGNDALSFRPERWLDAGNSLSSNDLLPFGSGHRQCIGKNIAMISIVKVLTAVWRRYKLEAVDPDEQLVLESVGIGEKQGPLLVRARLSYAEVIEARYPL